MKKVLDDDWNDPTLQYRIETKEARFSFIEENYVRYDKYGIEVISK